MQFAKHNLGTSRINRNAKRLDRAVSAVFEQMEQRQLFSTLSLDSFNSLTLDVRANGGVECVMDGVTTDYSQGQWSNVAVSGNGDVTIKATVVPVTIDYTGGSVTFHNQHGMRDINAMVSIDTPEPFRDYYHPLNVTFDETGDTTARTITIEQINDARVINGMAPANIFINEVFHNIVDYHDYTTTNSGTFNFKTGSGADNVTFKHAAPADTVNIDSAGGTDTVNIGGGKVYGVADLGGDFYYTTEFNVSNTPSYTHLVVDYSNEDYSADVTVDGGNSFGTVQTTTQKGYYFGNRLNTISFKTGDVSDLTVKDGNGIAVMVRSTKVPTNIVGNTTTHHGYVAVGGWGWQWELDVLDNPDAGNMSNIVAPLTISNPAGYTDITFNDGYDATRFAQMNSTSLTDMSPGSISWVGADVASIDVWMPQASACGFNFNSTLAATTVHTSSSGVSSVVVGNNGSVQGIHGAAIIDAGFGNATNIIVDDSNDSVARIGTLDTTHLENYQTYIRLTGLAPAAIEWEAASTPVVLDGGSGGNTFNVADLPAAAYGMVPVVNLNTGTGADAINVWKTGAGSTLNIEGQSGFDAVNVGNAGHAQAVAGTVNVQNAAQYTTLTVDDSADALPRAVGIDTLPLLDSHPWGTITGIVAGAINYRAYDMTDPITIKCGNGGNTVAVNNTPLKTTGTNLGNTINVNTGTGVDQVAIAAISPGTTLNVDGQAGNDLVNIGFNGSVQSILGTVTIKNSSSYSNLTVDDSNDAANRIVTVGVLNAPGNPQGTITGLAPGVINFVANDVANATIDGGSGANVYNVTGTPTGQVNGSDGTTITLNAGSGADNVNVLGMGLGTALYVYGQGANDAMTVDYSAGTMPSAHSINFDGGSSGATGDSLTIKGKPSSTFAMGAGSVNLGADGHVAYSDVETLYLNTGIFNANADLNLPALVAQSINTKVSFNTSQTIGKLSIDGAYTVLAPGGTKSLTLGGLSIFNQGRLDLADNAMTFNYVNRADPIAAMRGYLSSGYDNGVWDGFGIMSSSAYGDAAHHTGVGYADSADGTGSNSTPNSIKFRYTLYGDTNLDRTVDLTDFTFLAANFNGTGKGWTRGDSTYDGNVDLTDFTFLAANFNQTLPGAPAPAAPAAGASSLFSAQTIDAGADA